MYRNYIEEYNIRPDEVIVYLRKSRADDPILTVEEVLARHEAILNEWAEKSLGENVPEVNKFREVVSGETIEDRPQMQRVLKMIESPRYKAILVVEVQRLSRGDLEDCGRLMKLLRYTSTLVITPHKIYDLRDEYDRDAFERELKRGNEYLEYTKKIMSRGRLRSVSEGNFIGSIPPYGYDKIFVTEGKRKYPTLKINEEQADVVRMIFDLYVNKDMGRTNICHYLDGLSIKPPKGERWSAPALKDMLENVHYIGKVKWNWRKTRTVVEDGEIYKTRPKSKDGDYLIFDGKHEAIISEELFNSAAEKSGRNHRAKASTKVRNPLAGLLYCQCGRAMSLRTYNSSKPRLLCDNQVHCHTGSCLYDEMILLVKKALRENIEDFEYQAENNVSDTAKAQERIIKNLERRMQELEAKELAQWEAQANPDPAQRMPAEIFKRLNEKLQREKEDVRTAITNARRTATATADTQERIIKFRKALDALDNEVMSAEQKNKLLKACIDRITYTRGTPERTKKTQTNQTNQIEQDEQTKHVYGAEQTAQTEQPEQSFKPKGARWTNPDIHIDVKLKI